MTHRPTTRSMTQKGAAEEVSDLVDLGEAVTLPGPDFALLYEPGVESEEMSSPLQFAGIDLPRQPVDSPDRERRASGERHHTPMHPAHGNKKGPVSTHVDTAAVGIRPSRHQSPSALLARQVSGLAEADVFYR